MPGAPFTPTVLKTKLFASPGHGPGLPRFGVDCGDTVTIELNLRRPERTKFIAAGRRFVTRLVDLLPAQPDFDIEPGIASLFAYWPHDPVHKPEKCYRSIFPEILWTSRRNSSAGSLPPGCTLHAAILVGELGYETLFMLQHWQDHWSRQRFVSGVMEPGFLARGVAMPWIISSDAIHPGAGR